jgi:hypothetical protein
VHGAKFEVPGGRVQGAVRRVWGAGCKVRGSIWGARGKVQGAGCSGQSAECGVPGAQGAALEIENTRSAGLSQAHALERAVGDIYLQGTQGEGRKSPVERRKAQGVGAQDAGRGAGGGRRKWWGARLNG